MRTAHVWAACRVREERLVGESGESVCAVPPKYNLYCLRQNPHVHEQALFADVIGVEDDPTAVVCVVSSRDLPQTRDARLCRKIGRQIPTIAQHLFLHDGPRSNEAHLSPQHVPELRQLIEAGLAQEAAEPRDSGVASQLVIAQPFSARFGVFLEQLLQELFGVRHHGAELQALERLAALTDAPVAEQDGTAFLSHAYGDDDDQRGEDEADRQRAGNVEDSLRLGVGEPAR